MINLFSPVGAGQATQDVNHSGCASGSSAGGKRQAAAVPAVLRAAVSPVRRARVAGQATTWIAPRCEENAAHKDAGGGRAAAAGHLVAGDDGDLSGERALRPNLHHRPDELFQLHPPLLTHVSVGGGSANPAVSARRGPAERTSLLRNGLALSW